MPLRTFRASIFGKFKGKAIGVPRLAGTRKDFCEHQTLLPTSAKANRVSANFWRIVKADGDTLWAGECMD